MITKELCYEKVSGLGLLRFIRLMVQTPLRRSLSLSLTSSSELEGRVLVCGPAEELVKAVKSLRLETRHHRHCTTPHHSSPLAIFTQSIFSKIILNIIGNKRLRKSPVGPIDPSHISTGCHGKCQCYPFLKGSINILIRFPLSNIPETPTNTAIACGSRHSSY